jgi:phosphoribosylformylglycinamidine synthase subunit PurS
MRAIVTVRRRDTIADPEGSTIQRALAELGFEEVRSVRVNRTFELDVDDASRVRDMCERLLVNPVMEDFDIEIVT